MPRGGDPAAGDKTPMLTIHPLRNQIQAYSWGSRSALAELLGRPVPAEEPQAELWMGAHPRAPSSIRVEGIWRSLADVVAERPEELLGRRVVERHGRELPFLFKVLAAERALSIQAHPDREQAAMGCRREDALRVPRDAARRNYRDDRHKPEVLYALTPFRMLRGFQPAAEILARLRDLDLCSIAPELCEALAAADLKGFFTAYMSLEEERWRHLLSVALSRAEARAAGDAGCACVLELERQFAADRGVLAPLFLHFVELRAGQAIFTGPGVLHSYVSGLGIELMANSDNVVRGGLTSKHVDVGELVEILRFEPRPPRLLSSGARGGACRIESMAEEFALDRLEVTVGTAVEAEGERGVEILLCTAGAGTATAQDSELTFARGDSFLVAGRVASYRVAGTATLFRARVPI
ncbi:MAG: mannose-6-phosphate isomerase, class I [bacterium]|nr:mannose-6-phosphate isomerase, class I [bacterium]